MSCSAFQKHQIPSEERTKRHLAETMISTLQVPIQILFGRVLYCIACSLLLVYCFKKNFFLIHQKTMRPVSGYRGLHKAEVEGTIMYTELKCSIWSRLSGSESDLF